MSVFTSLLLSLCSHTLKMHQQKEHPKSDEEEDDDPDHCYFNKNVSSQPPPKRRRTSSTAARTPVAKRPRGGKRPYHRRKKVVEKSEDEDHVPFPRDRTQRKQLKRQKKEREQRVKFLRKKTCARTRSYEDQKLMLEVEGGEIQDIGRMFTDFGQERAARQTARRLSAQTSTHQRASSKQDGCSEDGVVNVDNELRYPYLDHCYCKMDGDTDIPVLPRLGRPRSGGQMSNLDIVMTPEVSDFQECETDVAERPVSSFQLPKPPNVVGFQRDPVKDRKVVTVKGTGVVESKGLSVSGRLGHTNVQKLVAPQPATRPHKLTFNPSSVDLGGSSNSKQLSSATSPVKVVRIVGGQVVGQSGSSILQVGALGSPGRHRERLHSQHANTTVAEDAASDLVQGADSGIVTESEILEPDLMKVAEEFGTEQDMNLLKDILKSIQNSATSPTSGTTQLDISTEIDMAAQCEVSEVEKPMEEVQTLTIVSSCCPVTGCSGRHQ